MVALWGGRRFRGLVVAAALSAAAAGFVQAVALSAAERPAAIVVEASEFAYGVRGNVSLVKPRSGPARLVLQAGQVLFRVTNIGVIEHNFVVWDTQEQSVGEIPVLAAGETQELALNLAPGSYLVVCTYPGHKDLGMQLELEVR